LLATLCLHSRLFPATWQKNTFVVAEISGNFKDHFVHYDDVIK